MLSFTLPNAFLPLDVKATVQPSSIGGLEITKADVDGDFRHSIADIRALNIVGRDLNVSGKGTLFVGSYGSIHPLDLADGQEMIIDNAHLVAWPEAMDYKIEKASSGWISSFTSGEGLVCRFKGPGRVLIQTRNPGGFGTWIRQFIPSR